jgi:hypothetical protein
MIAARTFEIQSLFHRAASILLVLGGLLSTHAFADVPRVGVVK